MELAWSIVCQENVVPGKRGRLKWRGEVAEDQCDHGKQRDKHGYGDG
jgi:hypothetical protein